ncbi:large subunit ribosomal protein L27e [Nematocida sp. AWRm77]|nr:large subunit ribosomal protein L27e [Nematocida sp. AWRm77]
MFSKEEGVLLLKGRYAGCKAVIVKDMFSSNGRNVVTVVGMDKVPKPVTEDMTEKQKRRHSSIRCFVKNINIRHLMPTVYTVENVFSKLAIKDITATIERTSMTKEAEMLFKSFYEKDPTNWIFKKQRA